MNSIWPKWEDNKLFTILVGLLIIVLGAALFYVAYNAAKQHYYIGKSTDIQRTITIAGEGKVTVIPDVAVVNIGYSIEKPTVAAAQKDNTDKMNSFIKSLKSLGIEDKDIQTTSYNVYAQYDYNNGKQTLRGYQVEQNVQVKIRNNDKISSVLELVGTLGLNQAGGLTFQVDDPTAYEQQARIKALQNAKSKASELSQVMGVSLGKVVSFSESSSSQYPQPIYAKDMMGIGGGVTSSAPSVQSGSQDIIIDASVTYELD